MNFYFSLKLTYSNGRRRNYQFLYQIKKTFSFTLGS